MFTNYFRMFKSKFNAVLGLQNSLLSKKKHMIVSSLYTYPAYFMRMYLIIVVTDMNEDAVSCVFGSQSLCNYRVESVNDYLLDERDGKYDHNYIYSNLH